jgi:cobaltochelatase CobS
MDNINKTQLDEQIKKTEELLARATDDNMKAVLQKRLDALNRVANPPSGGSASEQLLQRLQQQLAVDAGLSEDEVARIAEKVLAQAQITASQLAPDVVEMIDRTKAINVQISSVVSTGQTIVSPTATVKGARALFYVLMSDFAANNNVYLYGPAGTGKTAMAKYMGRALNYKVLTINCNQYTSPIEIIGGQTIDGYQEGTLIQAWGNLNLGINPMTNQEYEGAILLIDELPKLDPNTAGLMNDALSSLKDPPVINSQGMLVPKEIKNGRNQNIKLATYGETGKPRLFVIGTGNTLLLRPDPTYTANFAQDASLQDRFAGSTYRVYYDYELEYNQVLNNIPIMIQGKKINMNFAFLFNFLIDLREAIETENYTNVAFVSMRIMTNLRDTYIEYRKNELLPLNQQNTRPKTLQDGIESFMNLFTPTQRQNIMPQEVADFLENKIAEVNTRPLEELSTKQDIEQAEQKIADWYTKFGNKIF